MEALLGSEDLFHEEVAPQLRHQGSVLRLHYRKRLKSDRRVIMRTYGFRFTNETEDKDVSEEAANEEPEAKAEPLRMAAPMARPKNADAAAEAGGTPSQTPEGETKPTNAQARANPSAATSEEPSDRPSLKEPQPKEGEEETIVADSAVSRSQDKVEVSFDPPQWQTRKQPTNDEGVCHLLDRLACYQLALSDLDLVCWDTFFNH